VLAPIVIYLALMLLLAVFYLHPPTLGWVGLGVLSALALTAGAVAVHLVSGMGTNTVRLHPHAGPLFRLLVVIDVDVEPSELCAAARLRVIGRRSEVRVLAPLAPTPVHFLAADEESERREAKRRLQEALTALLGANIHAEGFIGTDDPLQAAGDVLADFPADEILFVGSLPAARDWREHDFERRARDVLGVPVSTVFGVRASSRLGAM
jgi:hypothetical protein